MNYKIIKRKLNENEIALMVAEIKKTPHISAYSKLEWKNCQNLFVAQNDEGEMLGACLNDDFQKSWTEIAALFVLENYRGVGIGKELFKMSLIDIIARKRNVLAMSNNPFVVKMMKEYRLETFDSLENLPDPYRQHSFILNSFYEIRWFLNWYRITEIIRKKFVFGAKAKFTYGLKICT